MQHVWFYCYMARTRIQAVHEATFGLVNPAMAVSIAGSKAVRHGTENVHTYWGNTIAGAGRLTDNVDGWLARQLGVTSRLGAAVDAVRDKTDIYHFIKAHRQLDSTPNSMIAVFGVNNAANAVATAIAQIRGKEPVKNWAGERMMFAQSAAFLFEGYAHAAATHGHATAESAFRTGRRIAQIAAYGLGVAAFAGYALEASDARQRHPRLFAAIETHVPAAITERLLPAASELPDTLPDIPPNAPPQDVTIGHMTSPDNQSL